MENILIEAAAFSVESAILAQQCGVNRIELCREYAAGGVTPSAGEIRVARELVYIPLHVIIRPKGGGFSYSELEYEQMKYDVYVCKNLSLDGVVFGILNNDSTVDIKRCRELVEFARPMTCTFHRAFDVTADPFDALEKIIECGFSRILTSGGKPKATEGAELIRKMIDHAGGRIIIMPGGKVRYSNIEQLYKYTGAVEFHSSAIRTLCRSIPDNNNSNKITEPEFKSDINADIIDKNEINKILTFAKKTEL